MKCSDGIRRSNSLFFVCKRQWRPIMQSMQLRKLGERQRPKPKKMPKKWRIAEKKEKLEYIQ